MYSLGEIIITREQIDDRAGRLAEEISAEYAGKDLLLVGVLKGAMIFLADICRKIKIPVLIDFIILSSYGVDTITSGVVLLRKDIDGDIKDKHVIIVEDIIDTGVTINYLKGLFEAREPASLKVCTAFDKASRRVVDVKPDYCGFVIPDRFVVGYGLDYANMYRNLPDLHVVNYND